MLEHGGIWWCWNRVQTRFTEPPRTKSNLECITKQQQKQMKYFLGNKTRHMRYRLALIYSDIPSVCCCFIGCVTNMTKAFPNTFYNISFGVNTGQRTHNTSSVHQIVCFHIESKGRLAFQLLISLIDVSKLIAKVRQQLSANWPFAP